MEQERVGQFLSDATILCRTLRQALTGLKREPENRELVHEAFRAVHSLKSEAQFLSFDELGAVAHEMEGVLDQLRRGSIAADDASLGILFPMVDAFEEMMPPASESGPASDSSTASSRDQQPPGAAAPAAVLPDFTEFERQLIQEAQEREERLYRLWCAIEESAPLKFPKAYLVLNNLELQTSVIRTEPPFEGVEDDAYRNFAVYLTTSAGEESIREAIDVDQVAVVALDTIPFDRLQPVEHPVPQQESAPPRSFASMRIEHGQMDDLHRTVCEVEKVVGSIERSQAASTAVSALRGLERSLTRVRQARFAEGLRHLPWLVEDLSSRLGKRVRLSVRGGGVLVDRRLLRVLSEPLVHLVRNAIDHGLESTEERRRAGKNPVGTIVVSALMRGDELIVQIGDDGRGIAGAAIERRAQELGLTPGPATAGSRTGRNRILSYLVLPGFSTRNQASEVSGRGVGLDAIDHTVRRELGGDLRLQTQVGKGSLFTLSIPGAGSMVSLLVVRSDRTRVAIPLREIDSVVDLPSALVTVGRDGSLWLDGRPIQRLDAAGGGHGPARGAVVVLRGGEGPCFHCDEVVREEPVPAERLTVGEASPAGLRHARIGGFEADFLFFDPAEVR